MNSWLDNADIQGRIPELEKPSPLASDAMAKLREAHSQPRPAAKPDMIQQLLKSQSGEGGSSGGLLDGIL